MIYVIKHIPRNALKFDPTYNTIYRFPLGVGCGYFKGNVDKSVWLIYGVKEKSAFCRDE